MLHLDRKDNDDITNTEKVNPQANESDNSQEISQ